MMANNGTNNSFNRNNFNNVQMKMNLSAAGMSNNKNCNDGMGTLNNLNWR